MIRLAPALRMLLELVLFRSDPLRHLEGSWATARRSFLLWPLALPAAVAAIYISERPFIAYFVVPLDHYVLLRSLGWVVGMQAGFLFAYFVSRFENLQGRFALFIESQNWILLASCLIAFSLNFSTRNTIFPREDVINMAIAQYAIGLIYLWYATWRALGGNPFYAAGIVVALIMPPVFCADVAGVLLYGQARPFYDPTIPPWLP